MKAWVKVSFRLAVCAVLLGLIVKRIYLWAFSASRNCTWIGIGSLKPKQWRVDAALAGTVAILRVYFGARRRNLCRLRIVGALAWRHTGFDSAVAIEAIPGRASRPRW